MKSKSPFFGRRNLKIIIVCVIVCYLLLWVGAILSNKVSHYRSERALRAQQEAFNRLPKEEQAIRKGEPYLVDSIIKFKPNERLFLDYLQRKFDLDKTLGTAGPPIDLTEDPRTYPQEIHFLARMAYPDRLVSVAPKSPFEGPTLTNVYSANCDHVTLPSNYWQTVEKSVDQGGYYLTHMALAIAFMKDNGCPIPSDKSEITERITEGMATIAGDSKTPADLRYEAIAFLQLTGHYDRVQQEWIDKIASEQNPDGSWGKDKDTTHTSLLAMWALLEYARSETPYEPLIHRPTTKP